MPDSNKLCKAELIELDEDLTTETQGGEKVTVQFNPETLKLSFANQIKDGGDQSSGTAVRQFVGSGTTKLSLQLWFDVTVPISEGQTQVDDVRKLTQKVIYFMMAKPSKKDKKILVPPGVSFRWGSFKFDGLIDSLEESIEFFSSEGKPLRASVSLNLSQQKILKAEFKEGGLPGIGVLPGTSPLSQATAGSTLQSLAASQGKDVNWQAIAAANGIENPRLLQPGQLIDMNAKLSAGR